MITSLDELVAYSESQAEELPALKDRILLKRPGSEKEEADRLTVLLPQLPSSYVSVAEEIDLLGVSIGFFELSPTSTPGVSLSEKLLRCNKDAGMRSIFERDGVYQIGSWDADPVAVAITSGSFQHGQVVKYSVGNPALTPESLADSFEQFLCIAGSLDEIRAKYADEDDPSEGIGDFEDGFEEVAPPNYLAAWRKIAEVVLS
ncbi:hypothetical protein DTL42_19005 [Bremerella cremea]|uniref:SMI1/KNR4 family protein n=1 Tax=Bremerella cremea TaxID=1031537 RepID=A0A368KPJ7_9BACT|nr:hypothetical protein [Bremerella cremea]RCS43247.1 hypothetical protein DTL42_19005 [Bremerella cremea]